MSLEAMETLASVEERLKQRKADAAAKAKQSVADAREQGERLIAEALGKAASEIAAWIIAFQCSSSASVNFFIAGSASPMVSVTTRLALTPWLCACASGSCCAVGEKISMS